ncbi:hypothetical protein LOC68_18670 [Blastopirellula sp. JC732]|uniref:Glycoside hydrolase family 42 N-terminal domain-containing protein n=1 Tax=Blastopirellula sediminis TaxID=2894196 RepID=A0A9X1MND5_9BACT|nr:hypothetical protein [Blastopirellula sediminis]MCC9606279.1 hypothetical protein [Blastopirellula sediminis]MCC9630423.1 hypothetical protein [Blastopirellula sediminis]
MKTPCTLTLLLLFAVTSFGKEVEKPTGAYASKITPRAVENKQMQGGLVRVAWSEIEPKPGRFDFAPIEQQVRLLKPGMNWTLAIHGGWTSTERQDNTARGPRRPLSLSPSWLVSDLHVETFAMSFRGNPVQMPKYWDPVVQKRLKEMLQAVGDKYGKDERLKLIYVPQMTSNGTEGHFNGVPPETLFQAAGINPRDKAAEQKFGDIWLQASAETTQSVLKAFPEKAVAFEVHELFRSTAIPSRLISEFQKPAYENRVGIGMWWISGKTNYQGALIAVLKGYQGDLYGQVIGRSDQQDRFPNGDYAAVFKQAEELGMRYIEPWNYEFENHTCDEALQKFNASTRSKYGSP